MRYHYKYNFEYTSEYGKLYCCDHPVYSESTLYMVENYGLSIIQQRYISSKKATIWTAIDPELVDELYLHPKFMEVFRKYSKPCTDGLYPTMTIRQIMWRLRMKPLPRQPWETVFDKCPF